MPHTDFPFTPLLLLLPPTLSSPAIIVIIISLLSSNRTPLTLRWPFAIFFLMNTNTEGDDQGDF